MDKDTAALSERLQDHLDNLTSPRSTSKQKTQALNELDKQLAISLGLHGNERMKQDFLALQFTFECNVPSRLLSFISASTVRMEKMINKGNVDGALSECTSISAQMSLALVIIQGVVLNHPASKAFIGRRGSLEILLELLLISRHLNSTSPDSKKSTPVKSPSKHPSTAPAANSLPSTIIDTLLCVLVDSSYGLRSFEEANGLQAVVKILKRAGTPREVRMKCLEFLYFYLLEEDPITALASATTSKDRAEHLEDLVPTEPSSPVHTPTPTPKPISVYGSSTYSFPSTARTSGTRSASGSSNKSLNSSSSSSNSSSSYTSKSTAPSSVPASGSSSPVKKSPLSPTKPSFSTPQPKTTCSNISRDMAKPRPLMMLKSETSLAEYVPSSPKKVQIANLGVGTPGRKVPSQSRGGPSKTSSRLSSGEGGMASRQTSAESFGSDDGTKTAGEEKENVKVVERGEMKATLQTRTINEKKEILGTMLGNVDALVEGVRKAGIWGLSNG